MPNIKLKNQSGNDVTYNNVDKIIVPNSDGGTTEYSSGGGVETCTLTISAMGPPGFPTSPLWISTPEGPYRPTNYGTYTVLKNSLIYKKEGYSFSNIGITILFQGELAKVDGDCAVYTE